MENAKIKINLSSGEIEISGSEDFVNSHLENIEQILSSIPSPKKSGNTSSNIQHNGTDNDDSTTSKLNSESSSNITDIFGEWFHSFKEDLSDPDKCLMTAFFIQKQSEEREFKTREITDLLKEHGIVLSNTSASVSRLKDKKLIFQTRKDGNVAYMRVSKSGENELQDLKKE